MHDAILIIGDIDSGLKQVESLLKTNSSVQIYVFSDQHTRHDIAHAYPTLVGKVRIIADQNINSFMQQQAHMAQVINQQDIINLYASLTQLKPHSHFLVIANGMEQSADLRQLQNQYTTHTQRLDIMGLQPV